MNELIAAIHQMTVEMRDMLTLGKVDDFLVLLDQRSECMNKVDSLKREQPYFEYTPEEKGLLQEILSLDESIVPVLKEQMTTTQTLINQHKQTKLVSKKYYPYMKQINGAFIDSKK